MSPKRFLKYVTSKKKKLESRKAERKSVEYAAGTFSAMPIHLRHYCLWGGDCHTSNRDPLGQLALLSTNSNKPLSDTFLLPSSIFGKKLLHELVVGRKTTPCGTKVMFTKGIQV